MNATAIRPVNSKLLRRTVNCPYILPTRAGTRLSVTEKTEIKTNGERTMGSAREPHYPIRGTRRPNVRRLGLPVTAMPKS